MESVGVPKGRGRGRSGGRGGGGDVRVRYDSLNFNSTLETLSFYL